MIESTPKFLQGVFVVTGGGYTRPKPIGDLAYKVPSNKRAQPIYFRGGNSGAEMVTVVLARDGIPMRYFPIAAKGATHMPLAVVEDIEPDQTLGLLLLAPEGVSFTIIVDFGVIEV